ncbi:MAG: Crp/Fnr family transcriptional regulator [Nitrospirae bacterium]|nr:Crp/Fnr family transcriptional regulator [Nitrospirota bacterium]
MTIINLSDKTHIVLKGKELDNNCASLFLESNYNWLDDFIVSFFEKPECSLYGWGPIQTYPPYTVILRQDMPSNAVYYIKTGTVKLMWSDKDGRELIAGLRHKNWFIGAPSVLLNKPYSFTVKTITECKMRCISTNNFLKLISTNFEFTLHLMKMLSQEIYNHGRKIVIFGCIPARDRLKILLRNFISSIENHGDFRNKMKICLPLTHRELAQIIAVTPEHLSRLLKYLEKQNIIKREKDGIILLNLLYFQNSDQ